MCAGSSYRSGGPLPPADGDGGEPRTLPEALLRADLRRPSGGLTLYDAPGEATFWSYSALLAAARALAFRLRREAAASGSSSVLLAPELPRSFHVLAFWGCLFAGLRPCLVAAWSVRRCCAAAAVAGFERAWRDLGEPPVLSQVGAPSLAALPPSAPWLSLESLLRGSDGERGASDGDVVGAASVAAREVAFVAVDPLELDSRYEVSHAAVLAHARAELAVEPCADTGELSPPSLSWMPFADPASVLAHCACVFRAGDEVHADTLGEPRQVLRLASRHRVGRVDGPPAFFRRAVGDLRRAARGGGEPLCLQSVARWTVQGEGLGAGEAEEFLRLAGAGAVATALFAPWGARLATEGGGGPREGVAVAGASWVPMPGVELRSTRAGRLQARGVELAPAVLRGDASPTGWVDVTPDSAEGEMIPVAGGVAYAASEVEAAVEAAPGVQPGSAAAFAAPGGLAVVFVPEERRASASSAVATQVRNHIAVSLGIHPQVLLPLSPCDLPRDGRGRPCRRAARQLLQERRAGEARRAFEECVPADDLLPAEHVFEEEFVPAPLSSDSAAAAGEAEEEEEDGDDVEERMEGARAGAEVRGADAEGLPSQASVAHALVVHSRLDPRGAGAAIVAALRSRVSPPGSVAACAAEAAPAMLADRTLRVTHWVHCAQCDPLAEASDGGEDVADFVRALHAWAEASGDAAKLRVLCVSAGRHVRLAGAEADARKSLLLGALLCASLELRGLEVSHLDMAPSVDMGAVADAVAAECFSVGGRKSAEALFDGEGRRLERRLRLAVLAPPSPPPSAVRRRFRAALLAGGVGGIGRLWAKHLDAGALVLLGRSPASAPKVCEALRGLAGAGADIFYARADLADAAQLEGALARVGDTARRIDFAANLTESFPRPVEFRDLAVACAGAGGSGPFAAAAAKLRGARNLFAAMAALRPRAAAKSEGPLSMLLASTVVGLLGAPRLSVYSAGARGLEALCAQTRCASAASAAAPLDPRCVALSAWADVGITSEYPSLAQAAPAAGFRVLSPRCGVLALEAAFQRFAAPRFGTLVVGVDAEHPRFSAWIHCDGSSGAAGPVTSVATIPGCVELIQAAAKKILGKEVKLGDSLVEAGLDSMSSLSLHSALVAMSGAVDLPPSALYDRPTVLDLAMLMHQLAGAADASDDAAPLDAALEGLLEDGDARRSFHLAQARDALRRGDPAEAVSRARAAADGATGGALAAALGSEAEALVLAGDLAGASVAFRAALEAREALSGARHPDTAVALGRLCRWALVVGEQSRAEASVVRGRLLHAWREFFRGVAWPVLSWELPPADAPLPPLPEFAPLPGAPGGTIADLGKMRDLNLDGQHLAGLDLGPLGELTDLKVLRLRRAGLLEVPAALAGLVQLRELWLTGNALSALPKTLSALAKLQVLALEGNRFVTLPPVVEMLKRLIQFSFDEQRCEVVGLENCTLQVGVLSVLRARGCGAAAFPRLALGAAAATPNLNTIFWANNALREPPPGLGDFAHSLRLLDLAHNRIASLGHELFSLTHLRDLSLAGNRLEVLPSDIGRLRCLQQLWLHGNQLGALPEELGQLESLAILELHHNRLRELPLAALSRLRKLNWLFAHGNVLEDGGGLVRTLAKLPRLKIAGLGANRLRLHDVDLRGLRASFGLGWNIGIAPEFEGVLSEALTTCDFVWDRMVEGEVQETLIVTFSAQGAPVAQGQAEVRALRDAMLGVDALYVCDPANAWYMQDPSGTWIGLQYFHAKIEMVTRRYRNVFMWGGSMGGSAALLFACLADAVHAFSPQVDLQFTWPSFATDEVRRTFRERVQESVSRCRGAVTVHLGEENHNDNRHAAALPASVRVHLHDTANHNTMKHVKQRERLLPLLKFEVVALMTRAADE